MKLLQQPAKQYVQTEFKIVIVTGLSNPNSCQLTDAQTSLITLPDLPPEVVVARNFPFVERDLGSAGPPSIVRASLANGVQFCRAWTSGYKNLAAVHWASLIQSVDHLLVITGSCGIQLLTSCAIVRESARKVNLLALGPVGTRIPTCHTVLLRGKQDWLSRMFFRKSDFIVDGVGHLDYWENSQVREIADQWLRDRISEFSGQEVISPPGK